VTDSTYRMQPNSWPYTHPSGRRAAFRRDRRRESAAARGIDEEQGSMTHTRRNARTPAYYRGIIGAVWRAALKPHHAAGPVARRRPGSG
jgi:hypothetical protein